MRESWPWLKYTAWPWINEFVDLEGDPFDAAADPVHIPDLMNAYCQQLKKWMPSEAMPPFPSPLPHAPDGSSLGEHGVRSEHPLRGLRLPPHGRRGVHGLRRLQCHGRMRLSAAQGQAHRRQQMGRRGLPETALLIQSGSVGAVQVLDAFGKPPSGLERGNFLWLGSWDTCFNVSQHTGSGS